jgi:hypothetical protein
MISVRPFEDGDAQDLADVMMEMVAFYGRPLAVEGSVSEGIIRQSKNIDIVVALSNDRIAGFASYGRWCASRRRARWLQPQAVMR